ncbi:hypothetical protein HKK74_28990 [Actinomadura alba]|uniref:ABC transporter-associated repeat protein n=2 Tax=Actinomadura alba TaxID=406431 RepID=A0ABR7LYB8_9ACTN|nr:hypothetical protein [Actinomadura alba]
MPSTAVRRLRLAAALALAILAALPATGASGESGAPTPSPSVDSTIGGSVRPDESTATGRTVVGDGHVDMGPRFLDGKWTIQVRDDTVRPPVWRNLNDVVLQVADAAKVEVPGDRTFAFLGSPGAQVWVLPQVQKQGVLWPGWNTQDPQVATTINREVTWTLRGVTGPGHFVLFANGDFGAPQILFDSARPYPQQTGTDVNTHVHGNWAFSAQGTYLLDIDMSGRTLDGRQVNDRRLLRVFVGGGDATAAFDAAPPPGFPVAGTSDEDGSGDTGTPLPMWAWALIGGAGLVVVVVTVVAMSAVRSARRAGDAVPAAPGKDA